MPSAARQWKLVHMLFADMGGFVLRYRTVQEPANIDDSVIQGTGSDKYPLVGERPSERRTGSSTSPETQLWHLDAYVLRCLIEEGLVKEAISSDELWDKSKGDLFAKCLTLLQIGYFTVALLVRVGEALPVAELEVGTAAFIVCALMTYVFTLGKPKSVECAIVIHDDAASFMHRVRYAAEASRGESILAFVPAFVKARKPRILGAAPPNDRMPGELSIISTYFSIFLATTIFSGVHVAGWNLPFSSNAALFLWRVSAIVTTTLPAFWMGFNGLMALIFSCFNPDVPMRKWMFDNTLLPVTVLYLIGRGILIEEMFRGLAYLPPNTFVSTWASYVPHIG